MAKMNIYTSYYGKLKQISKERPDIVPIAISTSQPKFLGGRAIDIQDLAPDYWVLRKWQKGEYTMDDYYYHFNKKLDKFTQEHMVQRLHKISGGADVVLLCYEKDACDCHRKRVGEWLEEKGYKVTEYDPPKPKPEFKQINFGF